MIISCTELDRLIPEFLSKKYIIFFLVNLANCLTKQYKVIVMIV
jgi:hypothetical protein